MNEFRLELAGEPVPKGRPRFATTSRAVRTYMPDATRNAEDALRLLARAKLGDTPPDGSHQYAVELFFWTTARRGDLDNLSKLVLDALNGVVWCDDVQVTALIARIHRGDCEPGTVIRVWPCGLWRQRRRRP